ILIQNSLKPAEVQEIALCLELGKATVVVAEDHLSLAIGKRGQNVRLAARLTGWDIDILTPAEHNKNLETMERVIGGIEGVDDVLLDKLVALGAVSVYDVDDIGPEPLIEALELTEELANKICEEAGEEVIRIEEEKEAKAKADAAARAAGLPLPSELAAAEAAKAEAAAAAAPGAPTEPGASQFVPDAADNNNNNDDEPKDVDTLG